MVFSFLPQIWVSFVSQPLSVWILGGNSSEVQQHVKECLWIHINCLFVEYFLDPCRKCPVFPVVLVQVFVWVCSEHNWRSDLSGKIILLALTSYHLLPLASVHMRKMMTFWSRITTRLIVISIAVEKILELYLLLRTCVVCDHYNC